MTDINAGEKCPYQTGLIEPLKTEEDASSAYNNEQVQCVKEEIFIVAAKAGGYIEVRITKLKNEDQYVVSVLMKETIKRLYLTTRRDPLTPRKFKRIDIAISTLYRKIGATKFFVDIDP